jgi:hypothetical protein
MNSTLQLTFMFASWPIIIFFAGYVWYLIDKNKNDGGILAALLICIIGIVFSPLAVYIIPISLKIGIMLSISYVIKNFLKKVL